MTVIATLELDDGIAPGEAAREADGTHRRFGTRRDKPHHLHAGQERDERLGHFDLALRGRTEGQTVDRRALHGLDHLRMCVTENRWPPRTHVIRIALAI